MKKLIKTILSISAAVLLSAGSSFALEYDFSGRMLYHNDVLKFSFTLNQARSVTIFSSSWIEKNFDPMLGLWKSDGSYVAFQDDGNITGETTSNGKEYDYGKYDFYLTKNLDPGTYIITLLASYNRPNPEGGPYHLSNGFRYDNDPRVLLAGTQQSRFGSSAPDMKLNAMDDEYEFHILNADSARDINPVPEPGTIMLLGAGLVGLGLLRRRNK